MIIILCYKDITTHLMHHIVDSIKRFGPVYSTWMYAFERFNSWLCRRALNRYRPEATTMETYRVINIINDFDLEITNVFLDF